MAGFQTHITVSSVLGVGCAWFGHEFYSLDWGTCAVAGTLCSIGGMMPDLDSDSGIPARETLTFAAAIAPMLLFKRLFSVGFDVDHLILFGAPLYLLIRFGFGAVFRRFTVHRGMFHSIPALAISFLITYLLCDEGVTLVRVYKAAGMAIGFFSHLLLDEIWSVKFGLTGPRLKSSFGTAIKFFGPKGGANSMCYSLLIMLGLTAFQETAIENSAVAAHVTRSLRLQSRHPKVAPSDPAVPTSESVHLDATSASPPNPGRPLYQARLRRFDADQR